MNAKTLALRIATTAAIALGTSAAMADSVTLVTEGGMSVATRAEVNAKVLADAMTGYVIQIGDGGTLERLPTEVSVVSRESVRLGAVAAQRMVDPNGRG